ncbi:hypothetical protein EON67_04495, partial [archaeon]
MSVCPPPVCLLSQTATVDAEDGSGIARRRAQPHSAGGRTFCTPPPTSERGSHVPTNALSPHSFHTVTPVTQDGSVPLASSKAEDLAWLTQGSHTHTHTH